MAVQVGVESASAASSGRSWPGPTEKPWPRGTEKPWSESAQQPWADLTVASEPPRLSIDSGDPADLQLASAEVLPLPVRRTSGASRRSEFQRWTRSYILMLFAVDAVIGSLALGLASQVPLAIQFDGVGQVLFLLAGALAWPLAIAWGRGYERATIGVGGDEFRGVVRAATVVIVLAALPCAFLDEQRTIATVVIATTIAVAGTGFFRLAARRALHRQQRRGQNVRRVILVGSAYAAAELATVVERESNSGMRIIGACVPRGDFETALNSGLTVVGDLAEVPEVVDRYGADAVAVTCGEATRHNYLRELSWGLEGVGVELLVHPGLMEVAGPRMHIRPYVGLPLLQVEQPHFTGWRRWMKRATDIALTSAGLIVSAPLMAAIAVAIKLTDSGPVIFRQTRVGLDGSTFTMLKFRSMHVDAEARLAELRAQNPHLGLLFKLEDDPRVTRIKRLLRKYYLDELQQLFNVLAGSL